MTELDTSDGVRARFDFAYDGTDFHGWARQPDLRTVQGHLEESLERVLRIPIALTVAGRTDAGVHASAQVAHADIPTTTWLAIPGRAGGEPGPALRRKLDAVTDDDIVISAIDVAPPGFDARFSATERRYVYRIADSASPRDPLLRHQQWWLDREVDVDVARQASARLLGLRDFAAFCKPRDGATTIRTLLEFSWERSTNGVIQATVRADAFCHSMVRSLVGATTMLATGQRDVAWWESESAGTSRSQAIAVAPARGLTLDKVTYPADDHLAERVQLTKARRALD